MRGVRRGWSVPPFASALCCSSPEKKDDGWAGVAVDRAEEELLAWWSTGAATSILEREKGLSNRKRERTLHTATQGERERASCWLREKGEIAGCGLARKLARETIELVAMLMEVRERV